MISPNPETGEMERLLYSGNLLLHCRRTQSGRSLIEAVPACLPATGSYLPGELSVRYSVGVTLQVFLKTLQKYAVSLYPQLEAISFKVRP